jgi:hypothetical protein
MANTNSTIEDTPFEDSAYSSYLKREFKAAGWLDENGKFKDKLQEEMCKCVTEVIQTFSKFNHSGTSAGYVIALLSKLMKFQPISPLQGTANEWVEVGTGVFQNIRCSTIFRDASFLNGLPYDIDGYVYIDEDGTAFTNKYSIRPVVFPCIPETTYVRYGSPKYQEMERAVKNNTPVGQK